MRKRKTKRRPAVLATLKPGSLVCFLGDESGGFASYRNFSKIILGKFEYIGPKSILLFIKKEDLNFDIIDQESTKSKTLTKDSLLQDFLVMSLFTLNPERPKIRNSLKREYALTNSIGGGRFLTPEGTHAWISHNDLEYLFEVVP